MCIRDRPIFDAGSGNRNRATVVGGECFRHCAIPAPQSCSPILSNAVSKLSWHQFTEFTGLCTKYKYLRHSQLQSPFDSHTYLSYALVMRKTKWSRIRSVIVRVINKIGWPPCHCCTDGWWEAVERSSGCPPSGDQMINEWWCMQCGCPIS